MNTSVKVSKGQIKLELSIATLTAKKDKTTHELIRLVNAKLKLENKSLSKVYKNLSKDVTTELAELINDILGKAKLPSFKEFCEEMKEKATYSNYDGLLCLGRFNKIALTNAKLVKQAVK